MKLFTAVFLAGMSAATAFAQAPVRWTEMQLVDLAQVANPPAELAVWDEMARKNDIQSREMNPNFKSVTGRGPAMIRWAQFESADTKIVVSIFHGLAANCDNGANSSTSEQSWADCPARISVTKDGRTRNLQATACFNGFPLGPTTPAPAGERTRARYDASQQRVYFSVNNNGKEISSCARSVKIPG